MYMNRFSQKCTFSQVMSLCLKVYECTVPHSAWHKHQPEAVEAQNYIQTHVQAVKMMPTMGLQVSVLAVLRKEEAT